MAHNIDKIIREKVTEVEHIPVRWRKDEVWMKLQSDHQKTRRPLYWYYAAASVAVLLSLGYFYQRNTTSELQATIARLEKEYNELLMERSDNHARVAATETVCEGQIADARANIVLPKISKLRAHPIVKVSDTKSEVTPVVETNELLTEANDIINDPPILDEHPSAQPQSIQPIVGFIEIPEQAAPAKSKKKSKLKLIQPSELLYTEKEETRSNILARIK